MGFGIISAEQNLKMNLYDWMLQQKFRYGQVYGQLCVSFNAGGSLPQRCHVNGQWQNGEIVSLGPPVKVTLKGQPGCILVDRREFEIYWRFADKA